MSPEDQRAKDAADRSAGIECRRCGCRHFWTVKTWHVEGAVRRRRACRNCGWECTSIEQLLAVVAAKQAAPEAPAAPPADPTKPAREPGRRRR